MIALANTVTCDGEWDHGEWSNWCQREKGHPPPHRESQQDEGWRATNVEWWDEPWMTVSSGSSSDPADSTTQRQ